MAEKIKVTALAGGVGGAKLAEGLSKILPSGQLSVIVNTGDDLELCGLHISPDLDTVCYTLAGLANPLTGWGQVNESWEVFEALTRLGAPNWFRLGDHDLALHMERTRMLQTGSTLTKVTSDLCSRMGIKDTVIPMSDQPIRTMVLTRDGRKLGFQEYFVKEHCQPEVKGFIFEGIKDAIPSDSMKKAINEASLVIICPSNPWVSIDPILEIKGVRDLLRKKTVVAVSPIIGGKTIKGPAAKMFSELGMEPGCVEVSNHYHGVLSGFILDEIDKAEAVNVTASGIMPFVTKTIMRSQEDRIQLAKETIEFGLSLPPKG